ncbi:ABC transporter substrate-binding protein [Halorubrum sp. AD140]|uniref:ABC transporter substrate-binding protein n=1 Tax=Halorubrum sp. AD140 TaxID=3050073 RepID=UPI002ACC88BF|nr:ABC transporter substrate-binding protein [Halorubrum sp. AD140]MDZ5812316.1 ABC transporter substrate-binding protein [Halorubrum sp. AD140]
MTRRDSLKYGGLVVGTGILSGCAGSDGDSTSGTTDEESNESATDDEGADDSYSVEMAPVGELSFDAPPERVTAYFPGYTDMCVALGVEDSLVAMAENSRFHSHHFEELDGVDAVDVPDIVDDDGIDKEIFYELDSDLHLIDPEWLVNNGFFGLDRDDVEEIRENVAPFFGNTVFRRTDSWHDYRYYTLYETFAKVAEVYQREERYEAFEAFHDEYVAEVESRLPPVDDRPTALLTYGAGDEPEEFSPYRLSDRGTNNKQWHDLGVEDALAGTGIDGLSTSDRGTIDYETMLDVDPDAILVRSDTIRTADEFEETVLAYMRDHDVASELTAVQEGRVVRGGPIYQGPLVHLFTLEAGAQDLYPEEFGDEQLFDRDRVAAIVSGEF